MEKVRILYKGKIYETLKGNWKIMKTMSYKGVLLGIEYLKKKGAWKEIGQNN